MNYYKRHIGDYAAKAGHLSMLEHGAYCLLMDAYYNRETGPTRAEALRLARARSADEVAAVDAVLAEFFTETDGRYIQSRIEDELTAYRAVSETNRRVAVERESTKRARSVVETCPKREPSHKPLAISHKEAKAKTAPSGVDFGDVSPQVVADFTAHRKAQRAPITQTALDAIRKEAGKAGFTLEAALAMCCARGWRGFKAEWTKDQPATGFQQIGPTHNPGGVSPVLDPATAKVRERDALAAMTRQLREYGNAN